MFTQPTEKPYDHLSKRPRRNVFDYLRLFFVAIYPPLLASATTVTTLLLMCFIFFLPNLPVLSILALCGSVLLALAYKHLLPSLHQPKPLDRAMPDVLLAPVATNAASQTQPAGPTMAIMINRNVDAAQMIYPIEVGRRRLLRYGVAAGSLCLSVLSITLILIQYTLVEDFLLIFPFTAFFPFSYLAYAVFQREVRIKRLRLDFALLGLEFPDDIVQQVQGFGYFALHITLAMLFTIVGLSLFGDFVTFDTLLGSIKLDGAVRSAMQYGFLGSYLFAIQLIYRRYTTYDLNPSVYMYSALTILSGLIFNFVAFKAISFLANNDDKLGSPVEAILSFGLGFFPLLAIQWFYDIVSRAFSAHAQRSDDLPLGLLDGISTMHELRLRDFGVDNVQNLASVDLSLILINTPFTAQLVVDWVDQAILYLYLDRNEIVNFRQAQVRTVSDFREIWKAMYERNVPESLLKSPRDGSPITIDVLREATAGRLVSNRSSEYLDLLYEATAYGPNLHFVVHYWKNADRQRKIDYLARIFPEYNAPKYGYALGQAFLEYGHGMINHAVERDAERIWDELNEIWMEIEKFPIDIEQTITLNSGLAWAGLAFLTQHFAPEDNLAQRKIFLEKSLIYYRKAIDQNQITNQHIEDRLRDIPKIELNLVITIAKSLTEILKLANDAPLSADKEKYLQQANELLAGLQDYLLTFISNIQDKAIVSDSQSLQQLQQLQTIIATLKINEKSPDWIVIANIQNNVNAWLTRAGDI